MDPKITSAIWSNLEFDQASPAGKLAALWLITNEHVDVLGYADLSLRRFVFETQLTEQALAEGFQALGKGIERVGKGYWLRNYIGVQFGRGPSLCRNNFARAITNRLVGGCDPALVRLVIAEYVELMEVKGFVSPIKGLPKGSSGSLNHKRREEKQSKEQQSKEQQSKAKLSKEQSGGAGGELLPDLAAPAPTPEAESAAPADEPAAEQPAPATQAEAIYEAYPIHVARREALRAIEKALDAHTFSMLMFATENYASAVSRWEPDARARFVPYPATWFNRESFLDDPATWDRPAAPAKISSVVTPGATVTREPVIFKD